MSGIPDSVLQQGNKADSLQKSLVEPEKPSEPVASPPASDAPAAAPAKVEETTPKDDGFEHKYQVLQGKYNKEIKELREEVARSGLIIQQMQATLDQQNAWIQANRPGSQDKTTGDNSEPAPVGVGEVDPEKYADYGTEIVELAKTVNALQRENKRLAERPAPDQGLRETVDQIKKQVEASTQDRFYSALDSACKEWREYNKDEGFLAWASEVHPVYRISRLDALRKSFSEGDAAGVALVFNEYIGSLKPAQKPKEGSPGKPVMPSEGAGGKPPAHNPGENLSLMAAKLREAQADFLKKRITEAEFDKIAGEYQAALRASK